MTWTQETSYGSGSRQYRLKIYGLPVEAVSSQAMTYDGDPLRWCGLDMRGVKFSAKFDLGTWKLSAGGISVRIADVESVSPATGGGLVASGVKPWTTVFAKAPTYTTWLAADLSSSEVTTMVVDSRLTWPTSGVVWIDSEAIKYAGVGGGDSQTFTTLTRGYYGTIATAHYIADGASRRNPEVTSAPVMFEGMRCAIFVYGDGDNPLGDGTQVWVGKVSSEPSWNGTSWTLRLDNCVTSLDQTIAGDLAAPKLTRGILYPGYTLEPDTGHGTIPAYPSFVLAEDTTANRTDSNGTTAIVSLASTGAFYETQEAWRTAMQAAVDAVTGGFSGKFYVVTDGNDGWHMEYQAAGASQKFPYVGTRPTGASPVDPVFGFATDVNGIELSTISAGERVFFYALTSSVDGAGSVPRGLITRYSAFVYLDSPTALPSVSAIMMDLSKTATHQNPADNGPLRLQVTATSASLRRLTVITDRWVGWTRDAGSEIRLGRSLSRNWPLPGAIGDLVKYVRDQCPTYFALGAMPLLTSGDGTLDTLLYPVDGGTTSWLPVLSARLYDFWTPTSLLQLITEELKIAGHILSLSLTGTYTTRPIRFAASTETPVAAATISTPLVDDAFASWSKAAFGVYNTLRYQDGYDAVEEKRTGVKFIVRDVASFGRSPSSRAMKVEPLSVFNSGVGGTDRVDVEEVVAMADRLLGVLGQPYAIAEIDASMTSWGALIGDVISVTNAHIPDNDAGTIGVTTRTGIVIGKEWDAYGPRVRFTVLFANGKIGGYAPACLIASQNGSSKTWTLTCDTTLLPSEAPLPSQWFKVNDRIRVVRYNNATASVVGGIVTSSSSTSIGVTTDSVWTPGSDSWYLTFDEADATALATRQKAFVHVAYGSTTALGMIPYASGNKPAFRLAP